jgi:phosphomannomutase/phosphoglucomutase
VQALGLALGTYIHEVGAQPRVVVGHDFRSYSLNVKQALSLGLIAAGCEVLDIGLALSPTAYFAQFDLDAACVAMVTASHNENGWTGVKMGAQRPLTFGPDEIGRLKAIALGGEGVERPGGKLTRVEGVRERYIADCAARAKVSRPLKVVAPAGNGTAGAFAPDALRAMGVEVVELDTTLDWTFPEVQSRTRRPRHAAGHGRGGARARGRPVLRVRRRRGPLRRRRRRGARRSTRQDRADAGARPVAVHANATFVVDVKSTGLYATTRC